MVPIIACDAEFVEVDFMARVEVQAPVNHGTEPTSGGAHNRAQRRHHFGSDEAFERTTRIWRVVRSAACSHRPKWRMQPAMSLTARTGDWTAEWDTPMDPAPRASERL